MIWCIDRISKTSSTSKQQKKKQQRVRKRKTNKEKKKIVEFIRLDTTMYLMGLSHREDFLSSLYKEDENFFKFLITFSFPSFPFFTLSKYPSLDSAFYW